MAESTTADFEGDPAADSAADEKSQRADPQAEQEGIRSQTEPGLFGMVLRDLAVVFAALSIWAAADTWYAVTGLWLAQAVAIGDAILVGLLLTALFHEWGHYVGARSAGANVCRVIPKSLSLFRFKFDYAENDHNQFHRMTYGGHIGHWAITLLIFFALPMDTLSRIALVGGMLGFVAFATFLEYHILRDTWDGADPGKRLAALTEKDFQQAAGVGALVGLFAIAGLA